MSKISQTTSPLSRQSPDKNQSFDDTYETDFGIMIERKFELMKKMLLDLILEKEKALRFTTEEVKRVTLYMHKTYFKHIRLYDYMLNNKQLSEVKRITFQANVPIIATSLSDALLLGSEE
jgi:hypothetical protein